MYQQDESPYRVVISDRRHIVIDDLQNEIIACGDARSAGHYAALLNKAYQRGYRKGYRDAQPSQAR